jgi:antitoxin component YwqK of YwqJK toxin-antitoxin module
MPHGKATEWYESGALKSVRNFINGVLDSDGKNPAVVLYSEDHAMIEVQDYRRGEPIGTHVKYHPNGKEYYKISYKEGKKEGKELCYSPEGKITGEGEYKAGIPIGKHWRNHDNGKQGFIAVYDENGTLLKPIEEWNEEGQKVAEYSVKEGKFDGSFKQWAMMEKSSTTSTISWVKWRDSKRNTILPARSKDRDTIKIRTRRRIFRVVRRW